jgi:hypothetical protein
VFSFSHTTSGISFATVIRRTHRNSSSLSRPQLHRPATPQWEKCVSPPLP